jgi:hypothetical protein
LAAAAQTLAAKIATLQLLRLRSCSFMKTQSLLLFAAALLVPPDILAQARGGDFQINKITKNLITNPQYTYNGAEQYQANQRDRWLEVEVEFAAVPEFTDELTFKYFILINGKLLTGEVTHANVMAGRDNRSVMYVPPDALLRVLNNRAVTTTSVQNITVQIVQQGAVKDELNLVRAAAQWYTTIPALTGFVLNKNETPFAPLYWDRYERIKMPSR